jgi:hypothetical protein
MNHNYQKKFFTRPVLTSENIRLWLITLSISIFSIISITYFTDWAINFSSDRITKNIRNNYTTYLETKIYSETNLHYQEDAQSITTLSDFVEIQEDNYQQFINSNNKDQLQIQSEKVLSLNNFNQENLKIEPITSALQQVPGPIGINRIKPRQEKVFSYQEEKKYFRQIEKNIEIPIPQPFRFASINGNRDIYETTATIELNENDVRFCLEQIAKFDPSFKGHILIEFTIHPYGYVIPESVKILQTDIRDPMIVQCIKKSIKRWKNFPQIAMEDGNFRVKRKYVF